MELKTLNTLNKRGMTLIELIIVSGIIMLLVLSSFLLIKPHEFRDKARDEKRISDVATLDRAVNEFFIDNERYPDSSDVLRESTSLPSSSDGPLESVVEGWIAQNLSRYISKLPTDPINDAQYFYSYQHNTTSYEINARLEYYSEYELNSYDGGNDDSVYEFGNDLTIL